jgi:hypothetical protein
MNTMPRDWIERGLIPIIIISAAFTYVILLGSFLTYERQKEQDKLLRQQAIAKCLDSGGHIGPGPTCWYDKPTKELLHLLRN